MTYIVGFSRHRPDRAALDLAAQLARSGGDRLLVVTVVPRTWPTAVAGHTDREFERWAQAEGERAAEQALSLLADGNEDVPAEAIWVAGRSIPQVLIDRAGQSEAALIVVGSSADGPDGRVATSSTSDRLLHSSPMPVAVAPCGYRSRGRRIRRATCGFRGDDASRATLARTAEICRRTGAALRVVTFGVRGRRMYPPEISGAEQMVLDAWLDQAAGAQEAAVAALAPDAVPPGPIERVTGVGSTWRDALHDVPWAEDDVLVIGSSSSQFDRVFLGSSAAKILRHSPVPVVVVP